ncbi:sulfotransferase family protein [Acidiphilium sp.]|uniref:sulfotransferase family protein n=1 Tax=Acidiphilium sp. TaxID=527 RepID=UPI003D08B9DE
MTALPPVPPIPEPGRRKSLSFRALSVGFGAVEAVVPRRWPAVDAAAIERSAGVTLTGSAREGLARLTSSMACETRLSLFGRVSVRYDLTRLARNAAMIERMHEQTPAIGVAPVTAPLFIMGLPRSGTSFLHSLLGYDPDVLVPRVWQTLYPAVRPRDFDKTRSLAARKTDRQLAIFAGMAPDFPAIHPIDADSPQECSEITAHVFQSLRFDTTFRVPSYTKWLDDFGHAAAFAFHKRYLQALQHGVGAKFWALKCPDHTFSIPGILATYPDARFVVVHRDPVHVFASVAHMTEVLRKPFLRDIDAAEIGRQVTERWIEGARLLVEFDRSGTVPPHRLLNMQYEELTGDPITAVHRIYHHFGETLSSVAEAGMRTHLAAAPQGGYGRNRYQLSDFGINPERLRPDFAPYMDYFGIKPRSPNSGLPA